MILHWVVGSSDKRLLEIQNPGEDSEDNCPDVANASQADCNKNGLGDACDPELCAYLPTHRFMRRCGGGSGAGGVRPEPYMGNEHLEIGQIIRFGPMGREAEAPALVLLGLSRTRSTEDLGDYAYERSRPSAALAGMQVLEYDPVGGLFDDASPSQAIGGGVPLDVVDHALCTVAVPGILRSAGRSVYAFGGRDWDGQPVDTLWRGLAVGPDGVFGWEEVDRGPERPRPRQGAGLFWSAPHGLLLVGGRGPKTSDATLVPTLIEPDRQPVDATTLTGDPLGNRAHFGYTQSGDVGLVYGGQDATGQTLDGLYAIDLDRLHVSLLDWPSDTGPGPRVVWVDHRNDVGGYLNQRNSDIYYHDLTTGQTHEVCIDPALQDEPDIDGDLVVWEDWRNNPNPIPVYSNEFHNSDIYLKDLSTGDTTQLTDFEGMEMYPRVQRNRVYYRMADGNGGGGIFMIELGN